MCGAALGERASGQQRQPVREAARRPSWEGHGSAERQSQTL